jgi:hypothetical protein
MTSHTDITRLANGVEVQNSGIPLEGKRKQVVEDVLNVGKMWGSCRLPTDCIMRSCSALSPTKTSSIVHGDKMQYLRLAKFNLSGVVIE